MKNDENRKKLFDSIELDSDCLVTCEQVHEDKIVIVDSSLKEKKVSGADGLITADKEVVLGIFTADCVPVFIRDTTGRKIALIHAGWKGLNKGIVETGLSQFMEYFKINANDVLIALGPHICEKCYTVDESFKEKFKYGYADGHLDMEAEIVCRLGIAGINKRNVDCADMSRFCTFHNNQDFISYRHGDKENRMLSVIIAGN